MRKTLRRPEADQRWLPDREWAGGAGGGDGATNDERETKMGREQPIGSGAFGLGLGNGVKIVMETKRREGGAD